MMKSHILFTLLCGVPPLTLADVEIVTPAPGGKIAAGTAVTVSWKDSGAAPSMSDLSSYTLSLYTGTNEAPVDLGALVAAGTAFNAANSVSITINPALGGSTTNAYFLGMTSVARAGGVIINYSGRFSITGMTKPFTAAAIAALANVGTSGPPTVNQVAASAPAVSGGSGSYDTPFNEQSGNIKYAPMQPVPPKKITAKDTTPLNPTSSAVLATTNLGAPNVQTTITQAQTAVFAGSTNTAAAAAQPSADDLHKFLKRWVD